MRLFQRRERDLKLYFRLISEKFNNVKYSSLSFRFVAD